MTGRPKECCTERGKMSCRRKYRKGNKRACMGARRRFWKEQMSYKLETGGGSHRNAGSLPGCRLLKQKHYLCNRIKKMVLEFFVDVLVRVVPFLRPKGRVIAIFQHCLLRTFYNKGCSTSPLPQLWFEPSSLSLLCH